MKFILLACLFGVAACAPPQMFMEFDIRHAPAQAMEAIPPGAPLDSLEVLLPVDDQKQPLGQPVQGFIKQEIPHANGQGSIDVYYAFGFNQPVAPAVVVNADNAAPVVPAAPAAPAQPTLAAKRSGDDDDDDD